MSDPQCYLCNSTTRGSWLCAEHKLALQDRIDAELDLERARQDARQELERAREQRQEREARDAFKRPILDAFDRLGRKP